MSAEFASARAKRRRIGWMASAASVYIYLLIVFGAFVRISGSGLGCGEAWPDCNGEWLPAWDLTTWIEWGHRLLAAGAALPILAVGALAFMHRHEERPGQPRLYRPALAVIALLVVQAALGAITVKLELPPPVTIAHFIVASLILGLLLVIANRALNDSAAGRWRWSPPLVAAALTLAVIAWGAWTANADASMACLGFPLCNGEMLPLGGNAAHTRAIHIHWVHRLLAYGLVAQVGYAFMLTRRRKMPWPVRRAAGAALILVALQALVGAGLVTLMLPASLRALHVAVGMALWSSLVIWAALWKRAEVTPPVGTDAAAKVANSALVPHP